MIFEGGGGDKKMNFGGFIHPWYLINNHFIILHLLISNRCQHQLAVDLFYRVNIGINNPPSNILMKYAPVNYEVVIGFESKNCSIGFVIFKRNKFPNSPFLIAELVYNYPLSVRQSPNLVTITLPQRLVGLS